MVIPDSASKVKIGLSVVMPRSEKSSSDEAGKPEARSKKSAKHQVPRSQRQARNLILEKRKNRRFLLLEKQKNWKTGDSCFWRSRKTGNWKAGICFWRRRKTVMLFIYLLSMGKSDSFMHY